VNQPPSSAPYRRPRPGAGTAPAGARPGCPGLPCRAPVPPQAPTGEVPVPDCRAVDNSDARCRWPRSDSCRCTGSDARPGRAASRGCRLRSSPPLAAAIGGRLHPVPVRQPDDGYLPGAPDVATGMPVGAAAGHGRRYEAVPVPGRPAAGCATGVPRRRCQPRPAVGTPAVPAAPRRVGRHRRSAGPGRLRRLCGRRSASAAAEAGAAPPCRSAVPVRRAGASHRSGAGPVRCVSARAVAGAWSGGASAGTCRHRRLLSPGVHRRSCGATAAAILRAVTLRMRTPSGRTGSVRCQSGDHALTARGSCCQSGDHALTAVEVGLSER
jgi:hypothetical protein